MTAERAGSEITTQQAAELLGVSQPYLVGLIDQGLLPARMVGDQRHLPSQAVLACKAEFRAKRRQTLREMARLDQELGILESGVLISPRHSRTRARLVARSYVFVDPEGPSRTRFAQSQAPPLPCRKPSLLVGTGFIGGESIVKMRWEDEMANNVGDVNRHGQRLIKKTDQRGNHPFARLWLLRCSEPGCGREYEANSCDFHIRRCPDTAVSPHQFQTETLSPNSAAA